MKCEHAVDLIVDSLMDTLDAEQRQALAAHLRACPSCAAEGEAINALWEGMGEVPVPRPSPGAAFALGRRVAEPQRRRRVAPPLQAAAAVALLLVGGAGGFLARGGGPPPPAPSGDASAFLLLVRGGEPEGAVPGETLVADYQAWAASLADDGRLVGGNKLMDEPGRWITGAAGGDPRTQSDVSGYFVVSAANYAEALELARSSPHIRYGGTFEIREIDPLN